jgi:hypothetical protein
MLKKSERDLLKMNKRTMPKKSARKSIERKTDGKIPRAMPQKNVKQMLTKTPKQIEREILRMTEGDAENKFGAPTDRLTVPGHETARATGNWEVGSSSHCVPWHCQSASSRSVVLAMARRRTLTHLRS